MPKYSDDRQSSSQEDGDMKIRSSKEWSEDNINKRNLIKYGIIGKYNFFVTDNTRNIISKILELKANVFGYQSISLYNVIRLLLDPLGYKNNDINNDELMRIHFIYMDNEIIGSCFVFQDLVPKIYYDTVVSLPSYSVYSVCIDNKYQNNGYGTLLLLHLQSMYDILYLTVDLNNIKALYFYKRLGFIVYNVDCLYYMVWKALK